MQVPVHSITSANKSRTAPQPTPQHSILDSTPIHFASTFFGRISVSLCLYLFAHMSLNYVATMYKRLVCIPQINYPVVFSHPRCASQFPARSARPRSARPRSPSSSLISLFSPLLFSLHSPTVTGTLASSQSACRSRFLDPLASKRTCLPPIEDLFFLQLHLGERDGVQARSHHSTPRACISGRGSWRDLYAGCRCACARSRDWAEGDE